MIYEIIIGYWAVRVFFELISGEDIAETDIRERCNCAMCSGLYILN